MLWRDHGREIISGDEEGTVTFWYSKEGNPLYVMKAHQGPITQMRWNEELQQLITCGKDKTVKVWQLPDRWIDESASSNTPYHQPEFSHGIEDSAWAKTKNLTGKEEEPSPPKNIATGNPTNGSPVKERSPAKALPAQLRRADSSDDDLGNWAN